MKKLFISVFLYFLLTTLAYHKNFELLGFFMYLPLFYTYEFLDIVKIRKKAIGLIFLFSYSHFLILFWWLRHISLYAPLFLSLILGIIKTITILIPFLISFKVRARKLPFYIAGSIIIEKIIINTIYPQPYLQANTIFSGFDKIFKPILLLSTLYQNIFLMLISYSIYSLCKSIFFKSALPIIEKINLIFICLITVLLVSAKIFTYKPNLLCPQNKLLNVAILQPNIDQYIKNEYRNRAQYILKVITNQINWIKKQKYKVDLIIGPETIFPYIVSYKNEAYKFLRKMRKKAGVDLLLGGFWEDKEGNIFNSAFLITKTTIYVYKKVKLVIFGEYLPLGNIGFIKRIYDTFLPTKDFETLQHAKKFKLFKYKGLNIQPLICFEGFLEESYKNHKNVDLYINLSNEGWYKNGLELYWAWDMTKALSIFSRTPLIRSTNTGISGVHHFTPSPVSHPFQKNKEMINFDGVFIQSICLNKETFTLIESIIYFITFCYLFFLYIIFVIILYILVFVMSLILLILSLLQNA